MKIHPHYLAAVAYLTDYPDQIEDSWMYQSNRPAGILFGYCSRDRHFHRNVGCLTIVASCSLRKTEDNVLIDEIRADKRIPKSPKDINPSDLIVFAEWQTRLDEAYGREPPRLDEALIPYLPKEEYVV